MKRALVAAFAVCAVLVPSAGAAPRISALDTSSFPELRVTIVAPARCEGADPARERQARRGALGRQPRPHEEHHARARPLAVDARTAARQRRSPPRSPSPAPSAPRITSASSPSATRAVALTAAPPAPAEARDQLARHDRRHARSGTALYDAIVAAADRLGQDDRPGRAIVVVTDGDDVSSLHSFNDAVRAAHKANAAIYAIGIAGPGFDARHAAEARSRDRRLVPPGVHLGRARSDVRAACATSSRGPGSSPI